MEGRPPAHLPLHLPVEAVGVCDWMELVTGGAAGWTAAPLSGVLLGASGAALGLGGAGTVPVPIALAPSAAQGEGVVEADRMSDVVNFDGFWDVSGVGGQD